MIAIRTLANDEKAGSLSDRMRTKRFRRFEALVQRLPSPVRIIDVGGTVRFWEQRGWAGDARFDITTVNLAAEARKHDNIRSIAGDATRLDQFADGSFDIAFSNSVIEHLFTLEKQSAMAREIARLGRAYWVQTPNFWFPMEPHFHVPGWQWFPIPVRVAILRRRTCGWRGRTPDPQKARQIVSEVRLMTRTELQHLFPSATIVPEKIAGLTKSWIVLGGLFADSIRQAFKAGNSHF